jgi:type II secretory pathway component GspD/PulD (secretin)
MLATSDEADIVVVMDSPENLKMLRQIAENTDQPVPQVLVEARIVELTVDADFEKEVNMAFQQLPAESEDFIKSISAIIGTPGANPNTTQGALISLQPWAEVDGEDEKRLTMFLRYLQTRGQAKILSAPCLILRRGAEGSIITGEEVPILTQTVTSGAISTSTEFKSVGIKLRVLPIMVADGRVRLEINPEVSTVTGFASAGEGVSNPTIAVRNARTDLTVSDGQLVSIGGLFRSEEREVKRQVPILGSIPVLGLLFRGTRRQRVQTQLVIFLTTHILDPAKMTAETVKPAHLPDAIRKEIRQMDRDLKSPRNGPAESRDPVK